MSAVVRSSYDPQYWDGEDFGDALARELEQRVADHQKHERAIAEHLSDRERES